MTDKAEPIIVYGTTWCGDCKRAKQFLGEQRIHYRWVDIELDSEAMAYVEKVNEGKRTVPTIVFPDASIMTEPSNAELAAKLGMATQAERTFYDIIIIGGGPAGLTAALYASREGLDTLVIEKSVPGGQAAITQMIDNFPAFDEGISGEEFARRLTNQARRFDVEILQAQEVSGLRLNGQYREVLTADGRCYGAEAVLIATGAHYRRLGIAGEAELIGINVHFCATCDGAFYKDKDVLVIGGGNSAFEEGLFLTRFARQVTIVYHGSEVRASRILQEKVAKQAKMKVRLQHEVQRLEVQDGKLSGVVVKNLASGETEEWHPDGIFVFIGVTPNTEMLPPEIELDRNGFVVTDDTLQSSLKGIFAAGDVRQGATAQAASAAGEGATVALMMRQYLRSLIR